MTVLESVLKEELERVKSHISSYEDILSNMPKGYISIVEISGMHFAYLKWREGNKIKSKYIGLEGSKEELDSREIYFERKRIEKNLKKSKEEEKKLRKALRSYGTGK